MNAHNEQQAAIKAMNAAQPAAAQEAVVWQWRCPRADTGWSDCDKSLHDELRKAIGGEAGEMNGLRYEVRALYAAPVAPVTAAPSGSLSPLARIADAFGVTGTWDQIADAVIARSTPAAPGIDILHRALVNIAKGCCHAQKVADDALAEFRIDASAKGERVSNPDELAFAARGFLGASFAPSAEESTREMRDTYSYWHRRLLRAAGGAMDYEQATDTAADSPKGGSDALDAARERAA